MKNIDKEILEIIDIYKEILENIDIDKEILKDIDIDKIANRLEFGISNRATKNTLRDHFRSTPTSQNIFLLLITV